MQCRIARVYHYLLHLLICTLSIYPVLLYLPTVYRCRIEACLLSGICGIIAQFRFETALNSIEIVPSALTCYQPSQNRMNPINSNGVFLMLLRSLIPLVVGRNPQSLLIESNGTIQS